MRAKATLLLALILISPSVLGAVQGSVAPNMVLERFLAALAFSWFGVGFVAIVVRRYQRQGPTIAPEPPTASPGPAASELERGS